MYPNDALSPLLPQHNPYIHISYPGDQIGRYYLILYIYRIDHYQRQNYTGVLKIRS